MMTLQKINIFFLRLAVWTLRFRLAVLLSFLVLTGVSIFGLSQLKADVDQDSWFMEDDALLAAKERMEAIFGSEDSCAVLIKADDVFAPEVLRAIRALGRDLKNNVPYVDDIVSLTDLEFVQGVTGGIHVGELIPEPIPEERAVLETLRAKALARPSLKNRLLAENSQETWLIARMKKLPPASTRSNGETPIMAIGHAVNRIVAKPEYAILHPRTTGMPVIMTEKMDFFSKETPRLFALSLALTTLLLSIFLRSLRGVLFPLGTALGVLIIVFGIQGFCGIQTDPGVIFMPVFISLAVSVGYSLHVFNHFRQEFLRCGQRIKAILYAMQEVAWPLIFSSLTTVAALLACVFIPLRPIRWVGLTSAALVFLSCLSVLFLLPALLSFGKRTLPVNLKKTPRQKNSQVQRIMTWAGEKSLAWSTPSLIILGFLVCLALPGMLRIDVSFDVLKTFGLKIPYVKRIHEVANSRVGSLYSYYIALEFPHTGEAKNPGNLQKFDALVQYVNELKLTKKTTSILQIIKDLHQVLHEGNPAWHTIPKTQEMVAQLLLLYENSGGQEAEKWIDYDYQRLKLMVEIDRYNSGEVARELKQITKEAKRLFPDVHVVLTGSISQYTVMQEYVSYGQIKSFVLAFLVVSILMMLVFGSLRIGLIAMIPNLAPALAVAAIMGYTDVPLDLVTVTIMPMILGLAVDDTIHFINHCQLEFERCGRYALSIQQTFQAVGGALFMTTVVLSVSFAAYLSSVVNIFVSMGLLVGAGLFSALLADYFITPALLKKTQAFGQEHFNP